MGHGDWLRVLLILGPIAGLLVLGLFVALRSGGAALATGRGLRLLVSNASQVAVATAACLVMLAVVQRMVGFHLSLAW
jgi:hypothetical protein